MIKVSVRDESGSELYSDSTSLLAYEAGASETILLPGSWAPGELAPGTYTFTYEAFTSSEQPDANLQDNIRPQEFFVSNTLYSKEFFTPDNEYFLGAYNPLDPATGQTFNYLIGNQYFTSDAWARKFGIKGHYC